MVATLIGQGKGKRKASDQMPEASGADENAPLPLRQEAAGAPGGGNVDGEGEGSGRKPDDGRKGRHKRYPHLSQKTMMTRETMKNSQPC